MPRLTQFTVTTLLLTVAILGLSPQGSIQAQDTLAQDTLAPEALAQDTLAQDAQGTEVSASVLILTLQTDSSVEARQAAAELLGSMGSGTAADALSRALRNDPDTSVRSAAARSLGEMGPSAREAIPVLIQALNEGDGSGPTLCSDAAAALGNLGRIAIGAVEPLARAPACLLNEEATGQALTAIAASVAADAATLTDEELTAALMAFGAAETVMGANIPPAALLSLEGIQGEMRSRQLGWLSSALAVGVALVSAIASALGSVVGMFVAIIIVGIVIFLLKNAGRFFPALEMPSRSPSKGGRWDWRDTQTWLKRPGRNGSGGTKQSSARRSTRSSRNSRNPDGEEREGIDVILGEVHRRYVPGDDAPPLPTVERTVQSVAWETMKRGTLDGWVPIPDVRSPGKDTDTESILGYAQAPMGMVDVDTPENQVRMAVDAETTAELGSLYLLQESAPDGPELMIKLAALQSAAAEASGTADAEDFLRIVAASFLGAARLQGEKGVELGIAEEALIELAECREKPTPVALMGAGESPEARLPRLISRFSGESHPGVRKKVASAIGELGSHAESAVPALMKAVTSDTPGVAVAAVDALGSIGTKAAQAAPLLLEGLGSERPSMQLAATRALGRVGSPGAKAAPTLIEWTSRAGVPHELRVRATEALGGMPTQASKSIPSLAELLRSDVAVEVRAAAALSLARLDTGRDDVAKAFKLARETTDPELRGTITIANLIREKRLRNTPKKRNVGISPGSLVTAAACSAPVALLQVGTLAGLGLINSGTVVPALFLSPVLAFAAGVTFAVLTRRKNEHPSLGAGLAGGVGASAGLAAGVLVSTAVSPVGILIGGALAAGAGAFGGSLVSSALADF